VDAADDTAELNGEELIPFLDKKTGLGTLRVYCEVSYGGKIYLSGVIRLSRYRGEGYTGKLTEIFNLPYVYGNRFPSFRLKGKKPLSASIMVQKYLRPAAVKASVIKSLERVRFGFHNFRHSLVPALVKLKCDPKTVQGLLRHEDFWTTMLLYARTDQEATLEAQGKFLKLLLGDRAHLLIDQVQ
jgi:integrase